MKAMDVMTRNVVTVQPDAQVREIAALMLKHRISAVPVVDADRRVLGIISEGDLMRRVENNTHSRHSWWLEAFYFTQDTPGDYVKAHGRKASDVMTTEVVSITKDTSLYEIARLLEKNHIKRVPVVREGRLIGIVSRANLLHGIAAEGGGGSVPGPVGDAEIREELLDTLSREAGLDTALINVIVTDGVVQLWGLVDSESEKKAAQIAAENIAGVRRVENNLGHAPLWVGGY